MHLLNKKVNAHFACSGWGCSRFGKLRMLYMSDILKGFSVSIPDFYTVAEMKCPAFFCTCTHYEAFEET